MRIAVSGYDHEEVVKEVASKLGVEPKVVNQPYLKNELYAYAAESYQYFDEENVVFDGSVLEDAGEADHVPTQGEVDLHEQIILGGLQNYDIVYIVIKCGCTALQKYMNDLYPDKVQLIESVEDIKL